MRHKKSNKRLGRDTQHRLALRRNLVASLIKEERIVTTLTKAKHHRRDAEKLITLAKVKNLQRYRQALSFLQDEASFLIFITSNSKTQSRNSLMF